MDRALPVVTAVLFGLTFHVRGQTILVEPGDGMMDARFEVRVGGLVPRAPVIVRASMNDADGNLWQSWAGFRADDQGALDLSAHRPVHGTYGAPDPMGLIWSMDRAGSDHGRTRFARRGVEPLTVTFTVESDGFRLLCDFGQNRKGMLSKIRADAIFVSHAHPDHSWGLEEGTDAPVYASEITHTLTEKFPIADRVVLEPGRRVRVGPLRLTAFPVVHSVRCPCIAVRLEVSGRVVVYSGDIVAFERPEEALDGAELYIGDGSTLRGSLVRRHASGALETLERGFFKEQNIDTEMVRTIAASCRSSQAGSVSAAWIFST